MKQNEPVNKLMSEANINPQLRAELLRNPEAVAERFGVKLGEEEVARLKKLGAFTELVAEVKNGRISSCDPRVCYPSTLWEQNTLKELIAELIPRRRLPIFYPVFYPAPDWTGASRSDVGRAYSAARLRARFIPEEIYYPADVFSHHFERLREDLVRRLEVMLEEKLSTRR